MDPEQRIQSRFQRRPDVIARRLPDRTVLLSGTTGAAFELNRLGSNIWEKLDGSRSLAEIAAGLAVEFGLGSSAAHRDVQRFADALTAADLIEPVHP